MSMHMSSSFNLSYINEIQRNNSWNSTLIYFKSSSRRPMFSFVSTSWNWFNGDRSLHSPLLVDLSKILQSQVTPLYLRKDTASPKNGEEKFCWNRSSLSFIRFCHALYDLTRNTCLQQPAPRFYFQPLCQHEVLRVLSTLNAGSLCSRHVIIKLWQHD